MSGLRRVLIVGAGSIGERHLRCFAATSRAIVSLCELNSQLRATVAERYGVTASFTDYEAALAERPDVVVICTPAHTHVAMAQAAAERGCHLLIEKPLSTSAEGVDRLIRTLRENRKQAGVAYIYRCHPALSAMRRAILERRFGAPLQLTAQCGQHFPLYRPAYREIYYRDRAQGGGAVQDALTHVVNAAEWLVGPIDRLVADVDHLALAGVTVEDTAHVLTRHGRVMGCFSLNQHQPINETSITVVCESGIVRFEYHRNRWLWSTQPGGEWNDESTPELERDSLFTIQASAFFDAVENGVAPLCSLDEARRTLAVNLAILRSAEERTWQSLEYGVAFDD
jgi:predicted dehydrogenase